VFNFFSKDNTVRLWDAETGAALLTLPGHATSVLSVVFSPDGKRIASGAMDGTMKLWDATTGALIRDSQAHVPPLSTLAFSSDGKNIASGSWDNTVKLWDAETGALLATLQGHTSRPLSVAFSPNGRHLLSASEDGEVRLWSLPQGSPLALLRNVEGQNTTYYLEATGLIDFFGPNACSVRALARCRIGPYSFPFDVCEERFYTPGFFPKLLAGDTSYLKAEFEPTPLVCPPSSP
jgi:WD40 repeat protein